MNIRLFINLMKSRVLACAVMLAVGACAVSAAVNPTISAKLDSASMMMGNITFLNMQVVEDLKDSGEFPFLKEAPEGVYTLLNDTVEIRASFSSDTIKLGSGKRQINFRFPVQIFDPGVYTIPSLHYVVAGDTAASNPVSIKITAPNVTANDSISPNVGPLPPYYDNKWQKFTDMIPDALYYYWWAWILGLLLIAALVMLAIYYRKHKGEISLRKPKPQPSPYEVAIAGLRKLREDKVWESGDERHYFTRLTEILREYLRGRFGINAMEMTSSEILDAISGESEAQQRKGYVEQILAMADFVKFAKLRPLPDDNIQAFENALRFVEETKPLPPAPETDKNVETLNNSKS